MFHVLYLLWIPYKESTLIILSFLKNFNYITWRERERERYAGVS